MTKVQRFQKAKHLSKKVAKQTGIGFLWIIVTLAIFMALIAAVTVVIS